MLKYYVKIENERQKTIFFHDNQRLTTNEAMNAVYKSCDIVLLMNAISSTTSRVLSTLYNKFGNVSVRFLRNFFRLFSVIKILKFCSLVFF